MKRKRVVGGIYLLKNKKSVRMKKIKQKNKWSQPRMRLDLPPGGFLRPPVATLASPDGAEGCVVSFGCSCSSGSASTLSGSSVFAGSWPFSSSRLWFQTNAAPELWMVISSGSVFLGKRRGCWHRLSGAEGSPHRVPAASPVGGLFLR